MVWAPQPRCGVGPIGAQVLVVVSVPDSAGSRHPRVPGSLGLRPSGHDLAHAVRSVAGTPVAAVLTADRLPLDIRHASKVDRLEVARQAARLLAGRGGS